MEVDHGSGDTADEGGTENEFHDGSRFLPFLAASAEITPDFSEGQEDEEDEDVEEDRE